MTPSRRPPSSRRALRAPLLALAALATLHVPPSRASWLAADPTFMGYRIPEHRWSYWTATVGATGDHRSWPSPPDREQHIGVATANLGTRAGWGYDSDPLQHYWEFGVNAGAGRSGSHVEDRLPPTDYERRDTGVSRSQGFSLYGSIQTYPWSMPLGVSLSTWNFLDLEQSFQSAEFSYRDPFARNVGRSRNDRGSRRYFGSLSASLGLGRVRDVTPVQSAMIVESRLSDGRALTRPLSPEARNELAALFTVESRIRYAHERSAKYFWRELERILREDGALEGDQLDAWLVLRLLESPFVSTGGFRRSGFFVGPRAWVSTERTRDTRENAFSNTYYIADTVFATSSGSDKETVNARRDDVSVGLGAEFHRPLGLRWQLGLSSIAEIREAGEYPRFQNSASVSYFIADRWMGTLRAFHDASGEGRSRRFDRWDVGVVGELAYFLEDAWVLKLRGNERQSHSEYGLQRTGAFSLSIQWIVSGRFEAPGLVDAMRPTPPMP